MKIINGIITLGVIAILTGCGTSYKTVVLPIKSTDNKFHIEVDQDSTAFGPLKSGGVLRENYKYSFAVSAQNTINKGYKYFSIYKPKEIIEQFKSKNVKNVEDAFASCDSGKGSFSYEFIGFTKEEWAGTNNCQKIIFSWTEKSMKGSNAHRNIHYFIEMHNENRHDNVTFNAQDVLNSDLVKGLNKEYFVPMKR